MDKEKQEARIYIDAANLHTAVKSSGWELDYKKFFIWLKDRYRTDQIFLFIGYIKGNEYVYNQRQKQGYTLVFKETLVSKGATKGNCDAELVLKATTDVCREKFDTLVLVSSDGDFSCLLRFAQEEGKMVHVVSPSKSLSYLIRKLNMKVSFVNNFKNKVEKEKAPDGD